jgi:hypothetical protein
MEYIICQKVWKFWANCDLNSLDHSGQNGEIVMGKAEEEEKKAAVTCMHHLL